MIGLEQVQRHVVRDDADTGCIRLRDRRPGEPERPIRRNRHPRTAPEPENRIQEARADDGAELCAGNQGARSHQPRLERNVPLEPQRARIVHPPSGKPGRKHRDEVCRKVCTGENRTVQTNDDLLAGPVQANFRPAVKARRVNGPSRRATHGEDDLAGARVDPERAQQRAAGRFEEGGNGGGTHDAEHLPARQCESPVFDQLFRLGGIGRNGQLSSSKRREV